MPADARVNTKTYLETYLTAANLTKDDDSTKAKYEVIYTEPDYPFAKELNALPTECSLDMLFLIGVPTSKPLMGPDRKPYAYEEHVPITTVCVDKTGITGTLLQWKANLELRSITETYPTGSQRKLDEERPNKQNLGSTILHSQKFTLNYVRLTTT